MILHDPALAGVPLIFDDRRPIESIWYPNPEELGGWSTNLKVAQQYQCDKIVAYRENGQLDHVPFFAVYRGEQIIARVPAQHVEVRYQVSAI